MIPRRLGVVRLETKGYQDYGEGTIFPVGARLEAKSCVEEVWGRVGMRWVGLMLIKGLKITAK